MLSRALSGLVASILAVTPTMAQAPPVPDPLPRPEKTGQGTPYFSGRPPMRFVKEGIYVVVLVHPENIYSACRERRIQGMRLRGCVRVLTDGLPVIIIPHPELDPDPTNWQVFGHEAGHSVGWPAEHPL